MSTNGTIAVAYTKNKKVAISLALSVLFATCNNVT